MIYLKYMLSELRRRRGRTILTSLGLGVGVALVIAVSALSAGLDRAQATVLKPLTGVGTDMSVTRPITISGNPQTAFSNLSAAEQAQLRKDLGGGRIDFGSLKAGTTFNRTVFRASQLSFPASDVAKIAALSGVKSAAGGLTLTMSNISGTVPSQSQSQQFQGGGGNGPPAGGGPGNANFDATTITGVDQAHPALGALTSGQITKGRYFSAGSSREAILDASYAASKNKTVGDTISVAKKTYTIIGLAKTPLGGQSSDIYIKLGQLQQLAGRSGRVNTVYVRATSAGTVSSVSKAIKAALPSASVTTAQTLASRVTGSLADAKSLTQSLGSALELFGLLAAILFAALLTLTSVAKRVREFGTLKAIGWSRRLVVRQVTGESLLQGLLGGAIGVVLGLVAAALIGVFGPTLEASIASAASNAPQFGPFGQGAADSSSSSQTVQLTAHVSPGVVALAVVLAVLGGLIAGGAGALRASRLHPAEALRHID